MMRATITVFPMNLLPVFALLLVGTWVSGQNLQATDAATAPFSPQNLISNVFLGDGVEVTNISFKGKPISVGYFSGGLQSIGLDRGIVMSTGVVQTDKTAVPIRYGCSETGSLGASSGLSNFIMQTDPDLSPLASGPLYDLNSYTITFIPTSDTLRFRYCFASEEYPEFACSDYNDIFGFFIQGPGYPFPANIAKIPGSNLPVAINNIHPDNSSPIKPCPPYNLQYYRDNQFTNKQPVYDGLTQVFTAEAVVVPCQTYTIRLVIADVQDDALDSGVFLEAKSFGTGSLRTQLATPALDGTVTEGCAQGLLTFRLPTPATQDFAIDYKILGTAINGIDYQAIPSNLMIPAGQQEITVPIVAIQDNIPEVGEYMAMDVRRDPCNRDTLKIFFRDNTIVMPDLLQDTTLCLSAPPVTLNATLPLTLPAPYTFTNTQDVTIAPVGTPVFSPINVFGVLPAILQPGMIKSVCMNITHGWDDDLDAYLIAPGGQFVELMTDCGANGKNFTNTCFTPVASNPIGQATAAAAPFTGDWKPEGTWSDLWSGGAFPVNGQWQLQLIDDQNGFVGTLQDWTLTFEPSYEINYQWSPTTGLSCPTCPLTSASPPASTVYKVRAMDSYGCYVDDSVHVNVAQPLPAPNVTCGGFTNSSITFVWNPVPGATGYEVNINGSGWLPASGGTAELLDNLSPSALASIQVRATGSINGVCSEIGAATCATCNQPVVSQSVKNVVCYAGDSGSVQLSTDNLHPPYQFQLGAFSNSTGLFANLTAGTYTATVTDNTGCQALVTTVVNSAQNLNVTITPKNITCFGGDDGTATASVTGGTPPYTYKWSDPAGQTSPSAVNLKAGTYTVTVTDMAGCTGTASVTLTQPTDLVLAVTANLTKCFGDSTGTASVTASGGVGPYQFAWSNGQTGPNATNLKAGTYIVTVTDAANCAKTSFALIGQPLQITATTSSVSTTCSTLSNGSATVVAQGGSGALTYKWSDPAGQTTTTATNLAAGIYFVTITDKNNCQLVKPDTVLAPPAIQVQIATMDATCNGSSNGSASATASGGTGALKYKWSDPANQTTATASNLKAGVYTVTVTDANGCSLTSSATVGQPTGMNLTITPKNVTCFGGDDGTAAASVSGGTTPYTYKWSAASNPSTPTAVNLKAGTYTVTVTDAAGCTTTASTTLTQPSDLILSVTANLTKCFGDSTGTASVSASGGIGAYQYAWNNGQTGPNASNLKAGTYIVTVTDAAGCAKTSFALIGQPTQITASTMAVAATCNGLSNGSASVTAQGGTGTLKYKWSDPAGQTAANAANLGAGVYTVTITDQNNCSLTKTATVTAPTAVVVQVSGVNVKCNGAATGSAQATASGGTGTLTYKWSDPSGQTTATATNLTAGTYTVTVSDTNGCTTTASTTINQPSVLSLATTAKAIDCFGNTNGQISTAVQGGATPYAYKWSSSETSPGINNKPAGTYTVTVTDANGCTQVATDVINQPADLIVAANSSNILCFGASTGTIQLSISGGTGAYTVSWKGPGGFTASGTSLNALAAGTYGATITDAAGCSKTQQAILTQPGAALSVVLPVTADTVCFAATDGTANAVASGGTAPYTYLWDAAGQTGPTASGLAAATYHVTVTDANACTTVGATSVVQKEQLRATAQGGAVDCFGSTDGTAEVTAVFYGNTAANLNAFQFQWSTSPPQSGPKASGLLAGQTYTVTITDALGCSATQTAAISNAAQVTASIVNTNNPKCFNGTEGWVIAAGQGGNKPYTYAWSPNVITATDSLASNLPVGTYLVTATDAKGCTGTASATLTQPPVLKIDFQPTNVVCYGDQNGKAKAIAGGGTPPYQFHWSNGSNSDLATDLSGGPHQLTVTDHNGCTTTGEVTIGQPDVPLGGTTTKEDIYCFGGFSGVIQIVGSGGTPPYRYALDNGNWNGSSKQIGLKAGTYTPHIQDKNGCTATLLPVEITQLPALELELGPTITVLLGASTQLQASVQNATGAVTYNWDPADAAWLSCLDCPNPVVDSLLLEHWFNLTVEDSLGCTAEDRVLVVVEKNRKVYVPSAFSPNGDGANDLLLVHGQSNTRVVSFQVFDRWGELLYEGNDFLVNSPYVGWDGSFRGQPMNPGIYVWVLDVEYTDGIREVFKGNSALVR